MKGIIAFLILILAGVAVWQYAFPALDSIRASQAQLEMMYDLKERFETEKAKRQETLNRYNNINPSDLARLQLLLPPEPLPEEIYVFFNTIIDQSSMDINRLLVTSGQERARESSDAFIKRSLNFELEVKGSYGNLRSLLDQIENSIRLMDVSKIAITLNKDGSYTALVGGFMYYGN